MIRFINIYEDVVFTGQAQYLRGEHSFYYSPWNDVNFSIIIEKGYNSLDIKLEDGFALQVTGLNPDYNWIERELMPPLSRQGRLKVLSDKRMQKGTGMRYAVNWNTYFDSISGWVCIGNPECIANGVEFAKNTIAVVSNEQLTSIWLHPCFV